MIAYRCTCGYVAASDGELGDHWGEAFIPPNDRDSAGVVHAEAARSVAGSAAGTDAAGASTVGCLCGDTFDHPGKLDDHLLTTFIPAGRVGRDGRRHAPAA